MDPVRNPYSPGAGTAPPALVGRDEHLERMSVAVQRLTAGRAERSVILTGLRGVGKTVLLNEFGRIAETQRWIHEHIEATEDIDLARSLAVAARTALLRLSMSGRFKERARRGLGVVRSFLKVRYTAPGGDLSIDVEPFHGVADSGDLDRDLAGLFRELGECAKAQSVGVMLTIDEMQYLPKIEFAAMIVGLHRIAQLNLPFLITGAGLPSLPGLAGEAKSYAERLFSYSVVGSLAPGLAREALERPALDEGVSWAPAALAEVVRLTEGYPYFLQEFGKQAWAAAGGERITAADVRRSTPVAFAELDNGFFRARADRTTDAERDYLRAMAAIGGAGPYRSGTVAELLGKTTPQLGSLRDGLIKRGLLFAPRHGEIDFTVPLFGDYIRRAMT